MKNLEELKAELKALKELHHSILEQLEKKKMEIACTECPLQIGEKIKIVYPNKEIEGQITDINYCYKTLIDQVLNNIDSSPTWNIQGKRVNKMSGEVGKWSFSANPIYFIYDNNSKTFTQKEDLLLEMISD